MRKLSELSLFSGLSARDLDLVAKHARTRRYPAGTTILLKGDRGKALYVIRAGRVKVHSTTSKGTDIIMAILAEDECFGELSSIDGAPRSADVTALEDVVATDLDAETVEKLVFSSTKFAWSILQSLAERIRQQNYALESLASRDVVGRVAELLVRLAKFHGDEYAWPAPQRAARLGAGFGAAPHPAGGVILTVSLTQSDIAAFVGATRERVSSAVGKLRRAGLIAKDPYTGRIVLPRPDELVRLVDG